MGSSHATWPSPVSWATKSGISRSSPTSGTTWRSCASSSAIPGRHGCATTSLPRPWTACVSTCTARSEALPRGAFRRSTCTSLPVADPWPLVAGLALGLVPRLVFDGKGERRKSVAVLVWIFVSALAVMRLVRRAGVHPADAALAGALTLVWLTNGADGVVLRPEAFANAAVMLAVTLLIAPPARWRAGPATGAAFLALTLAASI